MAELYCLAHCDNVGVIILVTPSLSFRHADRFLTVDGVGTHITPTTVVLTRYC